jgi:hypothetical protein
MSFVECYLPYFRQRLINCQLAALLPLQSLFTESSCVDQLLASPYFSSVLRAPCSLCCMFLFSSLFIIQFFLRVGGQSVWGVCWFISGVAVGILHATYLLTCRSVFPKQVWRLHLAAQEPSCYLSVMWHGEIVYRLGVQGVRVLILLGVFFCQVWIQCLSKIFDLQISCCLFLPSSHILDMIYSFMYFATHLGVCVFIHLFIHLAIYLFLSSFI